MYNLDGNMADAVITFGIKQYWKLELGPGNDDFKGRRVCSQSSCHAYGVREAAAVNFRVVLKTNH